MDVSYIFTKLEGMKKDSDILINFSEELYQKNFADYFATMHQAYDQVKVANEKAFSDEALSNLLTEIPLLLFGASEALSKFKLHLEVAKLQTKEDMKSSDLSIKDDVEYDKLIQFIYNSVVFRVESEISFSREFIMVLKKFWDARRATETVMPVSEIKEPELPEYQLPNKPKTYIG